MCLGSSPPRTPPPMMAVAAPPQPIPTAPAVAPPTLGTIPTEEKAQKKPKTYAARRRATRGVSGKKRFTIPLGGSGDSGVNA